jgi:hypothetical protein
MEDEGDGGEGKPPALHTYALDREKVNAPPK